MEQPVKLSPSRRKLISQPHDLLFLLDVADVDIASGEQLEDAFLPFRAPHDVGHFSPGLGQRLPHVPGDGLLVRHAKHEEGLAGKCEGVHGSYPVTSASVTAKF